jgi:GntR family transcriptional repressor for pyruvate dehydrogenase complex
VNGDLTGGARRYVVVAQEILAAIGTGRLSPGDRLPNERELARITGASRPTVRDALLALELFGVVEVRPGSGAYVTSHGAARRVGSPALFDSPPRELLVAREQIEPAVARLCAGRVPPEELARLSQLIDRCEEEGKAAAPDQFEEFLRLSHQFHHAVALNCGNGILADMTRQLVDVTAHPLWMVVNGLHVREQSARAAQVTEHRAILAAIADGDPDAAADAMATHLGGLSERIFGRPRTQRAIGRQRRRAHKVV